MTMLNIMQNSLDWQIDTARPLQAVLDDAACPPLLHEALSGPISWQLRNEQRIAAILRAPSRAPLWIAVLLALGARVAVAGDGEIPLEALLQDRAGASPLALRVPAGDGERRWGSASVARTPADQPIVAAVAVVELASGTVQAARVALVGTWPELARLAQAAARLVGNPLDAETIAATAAAVEAQVEPMGDWLGSAAYRRAMAGVLTRRALEACGKEIGR